MKGGFRWPWLARVTNGRFGLGRWTQEEVDGIWERARATAARIEQAITETDRGER